MCTHYTCINTIYTPLNTSIHPKYTPNTPLHDRYHHWINTIINTTCKTIAVMIAYKVRPFREDASILKNTVYSVCFCYL